MRQSGQDSGCGGFERDGLALKVYTVDSFGIQGLEDCTGAANKGDKGRKWRQLPFELAPSVTASAVSGRLNASRLTLFFAAVGVQELSVRPSAGEVVLVVLHD